MAAASSLRSDQEVAQNWYALPRLWSWSLSDMNRNIQGMAKGNNIPTIGPVTITWLSPKNSTSSMSTSTVSGSHESMGGPGRETSRTPEADPVQSMEEEVVASGWGGNGDDGDGMGML
jgi:RNA-binding protein 26